MIKVCNVPIRIPDRPDPLSVGVDTSLGAIREFQAHCPIINQRRLKECNATRVVRPNEIMSISTITSSESLAPVSAGYGYFYLFWGRYVIFHKRVWNPWPGEYSTDTRFPLIDRFHKWHAGEESPGSDP